MHSDQQGHEVSLTPVAGMTPLGSLTSAGGVPVVCSSRESPNPEAARTPLHTRPIRSGGQKRRNASPSMFFSGKGPKTLESAELARLSPITNTWSLGTLVLAKKLLSGSFLLMYGSFWGSPFKKSLPPLTAILSPGTPTTLLIRSSLGLSTLSKP